MTEAASITGRTDLVTGLLKPEAYPHEVTLPIRIAETHISWVLLTGAYAYKIKKPLRLSFLDYSTLAQRRACCESEVTLNRRYAPELYLGVSAIGGTPEQPRVDAGGPALEYAVRMAQFDPAEELHLLLAEARVTRDEITALGEYVARFHATAGRADPEGAYGIPEDVHRVTLDNFADLQRLPGSTGRQRVLAALESRLNDSFGRCHGLVAARRAQGWVRECHGDLHCRNVVRWRDRLTPFDGIEFDPALRFVDVASDLAFLTMDLATHGRTDLRHAALQAWVESLGDFAGLPLLPYFEAYRALVRAKVSALRSLQAGSRTADRESALDSVATYLEIAAKCLRRPAPRLILTCGYSGSGKSWLARELAVRLEALHLRSDVERKRLAGLRPLADSRSPPDSGIYTLEFNERTYARLADCARSALLAAESVIVDAAFLRRGERTNLVHVAMELGVPAAILHCTAPEQVLRERVERRAREGGDPSEAGLAVLARQPGYWEAFDETEWPQVISVDTTSAGAVDSTLARLRSVDTR